jgi:hypothetical protein
MHFSVYLFSGTKVPNWSISRDDKVKLTNVKIISATGLYVTRRPSGARPQAN